MKNKNWCNIELYLIVVMPPFKIIVFERNEHWRLEHRRNDDDDNEEDNNDMISGGKPR